MQNNNLKKQIENTQSYGGFIKTTDEPNAHLTSEQKALLNRKANVLFNEGDFLTAQRIFITTGYSDGLSRIAEKYSETNQELQALKFYWLARNKRGYEPLCKKIADLLTDILKYKD